MAFALLAPRPNSHPFQERQLSLKDPIKIGRAVAKAKSSQGNGIFDCKVLSRNHAVMWYENGKFMLQDTKSSNGTYVNSVRLSRGSEESEPCEIKSGDILQFGVEVVENSKNVTHGCIVVLVTLFHEDGSEATGSQDETQQGLLSVLAADKNIQPRELWQLSQFLQDALHREQMLENKLATLQRMIGNSQVASEDTFQGFIQEDKLLSRLETLENQLEIVSRDMTEEEAQSELISYQEERLSYESSAKETLQNILKEKIDALQKCGDLERQLSNTEDECTHLRSVSEKAHEEIQNLLDKYKQKTDEVDTLKEEIAASNKLHESVSQQNLSENKDLKSQLDEAEKRGSALAVEVESLQAECDFTKKQLEAMQERLTQQQQQKLVEDDSLENDDSSSSQNDLPFASDHATLEKDVKNKTEYIKTLKEQLANLQSQIVGNGENEQTNIYSVIGEEFSEDIFQIKDMLLATRQFLVSMADVVNYEKNLGSSSWQDLHEGNAITDIPQKDEISLCKKSVSSSRILLEMIHSDFESILEVLVASKWSSTKREELTDYAENNESKGELPETYEELKEVRNQIILLGERLVAEQEANKRTKELAASLELKLLQQDWKHKVNNDNIEILIGKLYEAHKHMNIDQLEKSSSYMALESARKLAAEMQQQASDSAKAAGHEKAENYNLFEENESLKMKVSRLESECKKLQQRNKLVDHIAASPLKMNTPSKTAVDVPDSCNILTNRSKENLHDSSIDSQDTTSQSLQEQLDLANQSLDEVIHENHLIAEKHSTRQNQLLNLVFMLFLLLVIFGALVMLDVIKVTPGSLPLLDERTWTEIWEHLF